MSGGRVPTLTARVRWSASVVVALILAAVAAVPTAPAALYGTYEHVDGFPTAMVTVVFSTGIVGVLVGMFVLGHVSEVAGRKRMLLVAVLVQMLALVVYAISPSLEVLLVARVISGLGAGIAVPTATAYIVDLLDRRGAPDGARRAAILATAANLGGFALGPVICGLLAEFAPRPLSTTYVVLFVVLAVTIIPLLRLPETRERKPVTRAAFVPRFRVSTEHREAMLAAGFAAFAGYAVIGLFGALAPVILREVFGQTDKLEGALLVGGVFGAAALTQVLLFAASPRLQPALGLTGALIGLVLTTIGVHDRAHHDRSSWRGRVVLHPRRSDCRSRSRPARPSGRRHGRARRSGSRVDVLRDRIPGLRAAGRARRTRDARVPAPARRAGVRGARRRARHRHGAAAAARGAGDERRRELAVRRGRARVDRGAARDFGVEQCRPVRNPLLVAQGELLCDLIEIRR